MIILAGLLLNAWPGVKYGIPFPVLCRSSFGYYGTYVCTLTRAFVAIMWLSFQMWQGAYGLVRLLGVFSTQQRQKAPQPRPFYAS